MEATSPRPGGPALDVGPCVETLLRSWEIIAQGSDDAAVLHLGGVHAAVFPSGPERAIYNNAVLEPALGDERGAAAIAAAVSAYADRGIDGFALWVRGSDEAPLDGALRARGMAPVESSRIMVLSLGDRREAGVPAGVVIEPLPWPAYLEWEWSHGAPRGLLAGCDTGAFYALGAWLGGELVAAGLALDRGRDCGIYNTSTAPAARRRGIATALAFRHLDEASQRGAETAGLQSTPEAESVYAAVGFVRRDSFVEYAPSTG